MPKGLKENKATDSILGMNIYGIGINYIPMISDPVSGQHCTVTLADTVDSSYLASQHWLSFQNIIVFQDLHYYKSYR